MALKPLNAAKDQRFGRDQSSSSEVEQAAGCSAFLQASQDLRIGGRGSNALYQYTIQADNVADLRHGDPNCSQR